MSDVTPLTLPTPQNSPKTPQKHPLNDNYKFQLWGLILPGLICNIVVKADLGRSAGRSTPRYWHLVVKNGNWQIYQQIYPHYWHLVVRKGNCQICWQIYPQMHHGIYIMGCIWQSFWILQEKVGISFYFWIIRLVNSQLALCSHVRCNSPSTPATPLKPPTWQLQISSMRAHICQV